MCSTCTWWKITAKHKGQISQVIEFSAFLCEKMHQNLGSLKRCSWDASYSLGLCLFKAQSASSCLSSWIPPGCTFGCRLRLNPCRTRWFAKLLFLFSLSFFASHLNLCFPAVRKGESRRSYLSVWEKPPDFRPWNIDDKSPGSWREDKSLGTSLVLLPT